MDNRRSQISTALAMIVVALALGYFLFLRGALSENSAPAPDSADYSVAELSLQADPETLDVAEEALAGGDLQQLLQSEAPAGLTLTVESETDRGARITVGGTSEQIFEFLSSLGGVGFATPSANGKSVGQLRGEGPLITVSSMKLTNDTGAQSASASLTIELAK